MILSAAAGGAAAAAAEAERQRQWEEEEMMSQEYSEESEYKILRSATAAFRNPNHLRNALEEEARAGWMLLEKFDDQRLRLKRPISARKLDAELTFDPYRTYYGIGQGKLALWIVIGTLAVMGAFVGGVIALAALLQH